MHACENVRWRKGEKGEDILRLKENRMAVMDGDSMCRAITLFP